jgi:hypothetical protein
MTPHKPTGCYICYNCPNHLINERFGYVIPCKEKANCEKYMADLAAQKAANQEARRRRELSYVSYNYKKKRR